MCYSNVAMNRTSAQRLLILWTAFAVLLPVMPVARVSWAAASAGAGTPGPEVRLQNVHMLETRDGATLWEVRADQVEVNEQEGVTVLTRAVRPISIVFFSSRGRVTCQANRATLDLRTKDVVMGGAIVARSDQGVELQAESLKWIAASRRLRSDDSVTITRGGLVSRGKGLEAETDLERVRILQNTTSQIAPVAASQARQGRP
jgi:LPS export ABC transporter protein LptC